MSGNASAELKANVDIQPGKSHAMLAFLLIFSAFLVLIGSGMILMDKLWPGLILYFSAISSASFAAWGWHKSHANIDFVGSEVLQVANGNGAKISLDPRMLNSDLAISRFTDLVSMVLIQKPLPLAVGTVGHDGELVENSSVNAQEEVWRINEDLRLTQESLITSGNVEGDGHIVVQVSDISAPPERS